MESLIRGFLLVISMMLLATGVANTTGFKQSSEYPNLEKHRISKTKKSTGYFKSQRGPVKHNDNHDHYYFSKKTHNYRNNKCKPRPKPKPSNHCKLYPIGISDSVISSAQHGQHFKLVETKSGPGNYSWLTWTGRNNVKQLARSLTPPGNSHTYTNPNDSSDHKLDIGDWVQGLPGVKNARSVRKAMSKLIDRDIVVPIWTTSKNSGANYEYQVNKFAIIRLADYKLNGKGYLSFIFRSFTNCNSEPPSNEPPIVEDISLVAQENTASTITLLGSDPDNDPLTYAVEQGPSNGVFEIIDDHLVYTPNGSFTGVDQILYYADDGQVTSDLGKIDITVENVNGPPVITSTPTTLVKAGNTYSYSIQATDPDEDEITYSLVIGPDGMIVEVDNGLLTWSPRLQDIGEHAIVVRATDSNNELDIQQYTLTVFAQNNHPPQINSTPILSVNEGDGYSYDVEALDPDEDVLIYSLDQAPVGMSIDSATGVISWAPTIPTQLGEHHVNVRAEDPYNAYAIQNYLIEVVGIPNNPPVIISTPIIISGVGELYTYDVDATDADNDVLTYSLVEAPGFLSIHPETGIISGIPEDASSFSVTVEVTDQRDRNQQTYILVIQTNRAPEFSTAPITTVDEQTFYEYDADAADPDGDVLAYGVTKGPGGLSINPSSGVVSWFADSSYVQSVDALSTQCRSVAPDVGTFDPVLKWRWTGLSEYPSLTHVVGPTLVAQINDDNGDQIIDTKDIPDVILSAGNLASSATSSVMVALSGSDGSVIWHNRDVNASNRGMGAVGDIDNDGKVEIIVSNLTRTRLIALENDGVEKWSVATGPTENGGPSDGIVIADLFGDGSPEIIQGRRVFDANGNLLWTGQYDSAAGGNRNTWGRIPLVANVDLSGSQEIVAGRTLYGADGSVIWHRSDLPSDGFNAVGNFDQDDFPEIVLISNGSVYLLEHTGETIWGPIKFSEDNRGGPPTIGDFDGDGEPEIGVAGNFQYAVLDGDGSILWIKPISDDTSAATGSSLFDFEGDGRVEVLYADEQYFRIYDGTNGDVLTQIANISVTSTEYPVIADIDNDQSADFIVPSNWNGPNLGIRVYESASKSWVPTRSIWNQHAYSITNVNDDGTIPTHPEPSWLSHNTYRLNTFIDRTPLDMPDLRVGDISFDASADMLTAVIGNIGLAPISSAAEINFYNGDPDQGGALLGTRTVDALASNKQASVTLQVAPGSVTEDIVVRINESQAVEECQYVNNQTRAALIELNVQDPEGLNDNQTYLLNVHDVNENPEITSQAEGTSASVDSIYKYQVTAKDNDIGDVLTFSLVNAPDGMVIDGSTGLLNWIPSSSQEGQHNVTVKVTDLSNSSVDQEFSLQVAPKNHPPVITSEPNDDAIQWITSLGGNGHWYKAVQVPGGISWNGAKTLANAAGGYLATVTSDAENDFVFDLVNDPRYWNKGASSSNLGPWLGGSQNPTNAGTASNWHWVNNEGPFVFNNWASDEPNDYQGLDEDFLHYKCLGFCRDKVWNDFPNTSAESADKEPVIAYVAEFEQRPDIRVQAGTPYDYDVEATDQDNEVLVYSLDEAPDGMVIDSATGVIVWTPDLEQIGENSVTVRVKDPGGLYDTQTFTVIVDSAGDPVIVSTPPLAVNEGDNYDYDIDAIDPDPTDTLSYSTQGFSDNTTIDVQSGEFSWSGSNHFPVYTKKTNPECTIAQNSSEPLLNASGWTVLRDKGSHGGIQTWTFQDGGTTAVTHGNGAPSILLSDIELSDGVMEINIRNEGGDDDVLGFVWGFQDMTHYYRLRWDHHGNGHGFQISKIATPEPRFESNHSTDVTLFHNRELIWDYHVDYRIILDIKPGRAIIYVMQGNKILQAVQIHDDTYLSGRFGFYVHSQSEVYYSARFLPRQQAADLIVDSVRVENEGEQNHFDIRVRNRGAVATNAETTIDLSAAYYDPTEGPVNPIILGRLNVPILGPGESHDLTLNTTQPDPDYEMLEVVIDPTSQDLLECNEDNNIARLPLIYAQVTDTTGANDSQRFAINVNDVNEAPQFVTSPPAYAVLGEAYRYNAIARDADIGDYVRYELVEGPQGMTLFRNTGLLVWTPDTTELYQTHPVTIRAVDLSGASVEQQFSVTLQQGPQITSSPVTVAYAGTTYVYDVQATDPEGDELTYSLVHAPYGMGINPTNGVIYWAARTDGEFIDVTVEVTDGKNGFDQQQFTVAVLSPGETNAPPVITSTPGLSATLLSPYTYDVNATDADGDSLRYRLLEAPSAMLINQDNGVITWTPAVTQSGEFAVRVEVNDRRGGIAEQSYILSAGGGSGNAAPTIASSPLLTIAENELYQYQINASDPESETLSYELVTAPNRMNINASGLLAWTPITSDVGIHSIELRVHDTAGNYAQQSYNLAVTSLVNLAPQITSSPVFNGKAGEGYSYAVIATDPNGDSINYVLSQAPTGMTINDQTGVIQWSPTASEIGSYLVVVQADDNKGGMAQQSYSLNIANNNAPAITSTPVLTGVAEQLYSYAVTAMDPDGDALNYSLPQAPQGMAIDNSGAIIWTPASNQTKIHTVSVAVTDSDGMSAIQTYNLSIAPVSGPNQAPKITGNLPGVATVGKLYQTSVPVTDPDGDTLLYNLVSGPAGIAVSDSGEITWTPTADQAGLQQVIIEISDSEYSVTLNANITVNADVLPLTLSITATPTTAQPNEAVQITLTTQGGEGDIDLSATINGQAITLTNGQAQVSRSNSGRYDVAASATDSANGEVVTASTYFTVADSTDTVPPQVILESPYDGSNISAPTDVVATVLDDNLVDYILVLNRKGQSNYTVIAEGRSPVTSSVIGVLDPSVQLNGQYNLILQATDTNGQISTASASINIEGDLKVGNFSFTVTDLEIPVAGIPIRVNRTYDSRRRAEKLDFGYGWSVDYQNVRVEESRTPGKYWALNTYRYGPLNVLTRFCVEPQGAPTLTVTLPDGDQESFEVAATPTCGEMVPLLDVTLDFVPVGDTQSELVALNDSSGRLVNGHLVETSTFSEPLNPDRYQLTTREGYIYTLDQGFGVIQINTPNGQTLSYSDAGIIHSGGKSVLFNRDADGIITSITDPKGNTLEYSYNSIEDLVTATDQADATTSYTYNNNHGLLDIIDPLGRTLLKNIYDEDGRLIAQEDGNGNRTEFNHDIEGRFSLVTDRNGHNTQFYYDDEGNVLTQIDHLGNTTSFLYDDRGNQLSKTDASGNISSATYNANNDQLTQTDALGNTVSFGYNTRGQETLITDARGNSYTNTYDSVGNLLTVTDPDGNIAGNNINAQGLPSSTVDALGNSTSFTYDGDGNKLTETDAEGNVTSYSYDANGNALTESRTRNIAGVDVTETTTHEYDERNRLIATTDALGNVTRTEYNLAGHESASIDSLGNRTEMEYDLYGRLTETRYPDGNTETKSYGPEGSLLTETDRNGNTTTYEYDALNRRTRTTYADGASTQTEYDALGRVTAEIDELGSRTENEYDAAGRRILTRDAQGSEHRFEYDADGNLTAEIDALNRRTEHTYNALDQRITTTYHNASSVGVEFDAMSRRTGQTDQASITTTYTYDSLGRLTKVTDALGSETSYSYDEVGNKLTQTDAAGRTTSWSYDALGRVLSRTLPLGQVESFTYEANGNVISQTDFNGNTTTHQYDSNNRLIQSDFVDGRQETFSYDAQGNRVQVQVNLPSGGTEITNYSYDARNRLQTEAQPDGTTLTYQYDAAGNRTQVLVTLPNTTTQTTDYSYDNLNRLQSVTDASGITSYGYDAVGNRTSISYPNGASQVYVYDDLNRLTSLEIYDGTGGLVKSYAHTLHPTGRRTGIDEQDGRSTSYGYDDLYRLISETITDGINGNYSASYQYDAVGNRTYSTIDGVQTAYTYDNNDRLIQQGGTTYSYDDNGNTLTETLDGNTISYSYDSKNQLTGSVKGGTTTSYSYNPDGIRTGKSEGATSTSYVVDSNRSYAQVLMELANGTTNAAYIHGDDLISQTRGGTTSFYHYDGLGSTRALTDDTGVISDSYNYEAFGQVLNQAGTTENDYLFTGEQYDSGLDQYYLRARYYDQGIGRFMQQDEWIGLDENPITLNKYLYANSDGINGIDPSGNMTMMGQMTAFSGLAILSAGAISVGQSLLDISWDTNGSFIPNSNIGDSLAAISAYMQVKSKVNYKAQELSWAVERALASTSNQWHAHHTVPIYTCGAVNQSPNMVPLKAGFHQALHFSLRIYAEFIDKIYGVAFDTGKPMFDFTSASNRNGLRNLAQTSVGRSFIGNHLDAFYSMGWYAGNVNFKPRFQAEKSMFISNSSRNSLPNCQR